mmetsp:Transcript_80986/g.203831  ORF Transcript_80986/g.203831 Transcript_80986/m.203831 type:complete len:584 (+) Transcript_80986:116-1867(+)
MMQYAASMPQAQLDPTRKISRQVGWLNKNVPLRGKLSYSDIVEPLSRLDITSAMKILKEVEEQAGQIDNPTAYVAAAAVRAGGTGPVGGIQGTGAPALSPMAGSAPPVQDPTGKIARQIGWLNRNVTLNEKLSFSDLVSPLSWLDVTSAMAILKDVEEKAQFIPDPTGYVLTACSQQGVPMDATAAAPPASGMVQVQMLVDPTGKIGRQVGWLNKNVVMREAISFSDVVEPLSMIDVTRAMAILKEVETNAATIDRPTVYITDAASRALSTYGVSQEAMVHGGAAPVAQGALDPTGKIARQVAWLNKNAGLSELLSFNDVVQQLSILDIREAMAILKDLEEQAQNVKNPAGYVLSAAARAQTAMKPAMPAMPSMSHVPMSMPAAPAHGALDPTGKIRRQVTWLNNNVRMAQPINFEAVVAPLSGLDIVSAMRILKDIEEGAAGIPNPTGYVTAVAAARAASAPPSVVGGCGSFAPAPLPAASFTAQQKRSWTQDAVSPAEDEGSRQISKQIGWINSHVPLMEKLSYSDTKPHLEAVGVEAALKILKDVEGSAGTIKSPTSYVIAAAKRAASGEGIPAKRMRAF